MTQAGFGAGTPTRRSVVGGLATGAALLAAPRVRAAAGDTIRIGWVSPRTGPLAFFSEPEAFLLQQVRQAIGSGIRIGGKLYAVEIIERDSQSSSNTAAQVAADLIGKNDIHFMLSSHTPDTINPVSDACEVNGVPCLTTDCPWQAWFFGRRGDPKVGFDWTYHFFFGVGEMSNCFADLWDGLPTNKVVGSMWPNDSDGNAFADPQNGYPPTIAKRGYKLVDTGRFPTFSDDFSAQIAALKAGNCEVVTSVLPPTSFTTFWTQAAQQGYRPKMLTAGKSLEFIDPVKALGARAHNLCLEVWWAPQYPYGSHLTGQSSAELAAAYAKATGRYWTMPLGFTHALLEVAVDVLKRSKSIEAGDIRDAIRATNYESVVGPISFANGPVKNVCAMPLTGGQWQDTGNGIDLKIVTNKGDPKVPLTGSLRPL